MKNGQTHLGIVKSIESFLDNNNVERADAVLIANLLKQRIMEDDVSVVEKKTLA